MAVEFESRRSPAHLVRPTGHKFVAGSLIVSDAEAAAIRAYARTYPQFGIRELVPPPTAPAPAPFAVPTEEQKRTRRRPAAVEAEQAEEPAEPGEAAE